MSNFKRNFAALLRKKWISTLRNKQFWLFTFVPPLLLVAVAAFFIDTEAVLANIGKQTPLAADIDFRLYGYSKFDYVAPKPTYAQNFTAYMKKLKIYDSITDNVEFDSEQALRESLKNITILDEVRYAAMNAYRVTGSAFNVTVYYNRTETLSLPRAICRLASPLIWQRFPGAQPLTRERSLPFGSDRVSVFARMAPLLMAAFAIAVSMGAFGVIMVDERQKGLKRQLHMCGVSSASYWLSHFVVDLTAQAVVTTTCMLILGIGRGFGQVPVFGVFLLLLAYAPSAILMAYTLSFLFDDASTAQKWFPATVNGLLLASIPLLVVLYAAIVYPFAIVFVCLLCFLPFFALFSGFVLLVLGDHGSFAAVVCSSIAASFLWALLLFATDRRKRRPMKVEKPDPTVRKWLRRGETEAEDVRTERLRVERDEDGHDAVRVVGVKRRFGKGKTATLALRGATFGIRKGECFGLLGPNGAGKTTLIGALSGSIAVDHGEMVVDGCRLPQDRQLLYTKLGVCPQMDCLYDLLTPREHFRLFGAIKDVSDRELEKHLFDILKQLKFGNHLDKYCSTLSGGTKRKLSLALALLGNPSVVWLDEPTTGMDPLARRATWNVIASLRSPKRTFILTTHNMEEAEALCSRIGILASGRLRTIGSSLELKIRHASGHRLDVTAPLDAIDAVDNVIQTTFQSVATPLSDFGATRRYQFSAMPLGKIFDFMEANKAALRILDYSVSEPTLEMVFLDLVAQIERSDAEFAASQAEAESVEADVDNDVSRRRNDDNDDNEHFF